MLLFTGTLFAGVVWVLLCFDCLSRVGYLYLFLFAFVGNVCVVVWCFFLFCLGGMLFTCLLFFVL